MAAGIKLDQALGWIGTASTVALFSSPAGTIRAIARNKSVGDFDSTPYVTTFFQCGLWVSYCAITPDRLNVLVVNVAGVYLELMWCSIYFYFCTCKAKLFLKMGTAVGLVLALTFLDLRFVAHLALKPLEGGETLETEFLGLVAVVANIVAYASPLAVFRQVIRTRSVDSMPLGLSVATLVSSAIWAAYSALKHDPWVMTPNICGVALGSIQVALYSVYCGGSKAAQQAECTSADAGVLDCGGASARKDVPGEATRARSPRGPEESV